MSSLETKLEERLAELKVEYAQLHANLNAVSGAIRMCEQVLAELRAEEAPKDTTNGS